MVTVRVSETYDLSTEVNRLGLIGIHTPGIKGIVQMWSGLMRNYRYMRLVGCDVSMACASMLPADPLQIGVEAGDVAPQDMFNPILYKAVSNDSFNTLVNRIYNPNLAALTPSLEVTDLQGTATDIDEFDTYYGLLADPDGWRKAMPQSGLTMKGLYPIVYQVVNNYGNQNSPVEQNAITKVPWVMQYDEAGDSKEVNFNTQAFQFRGPALRMPRIPTMAPRISDYIDTTQMEEDAYETIFNQAGQPSDEKIKSYEVQLFNAFPTTYVGVIVMPPAKLNKLYYRMKVTWTIEFTEVRPLQELQALNGNELLGQTMYHTDYAFQSKNMDKTTNMVDTSGAEIDKVMESAR